LVARLVCETLVEADEPVDVTRPGWDAMFPGSVHDAFEEYLDRFGPDRPRVVGLLRPLAYAEGDGLPFENLWSSLASSLAGLAYTDEDVEWLLGRAGAFLVEAMSDGRSVYRLYHQAMAEHLRSQQTAIEQRRQYEISRTLTDQTPDRSDGVGKDWSRAHPYVRRHLAAHAAAAGPLQALAADPLFLVAAEPEHFLRVLIEHRRGLPYEAVELYQGAFYHLRGTDIGVRASYLELVARQFGHSVFADSVARLPLARPFVVPWVAWKRPWPHRMICTQIKLSCLAVGTAGGRPVVVTSSGDYGSKGDILVWDLETGASRGDLLRFHPAAISAIAVGDVAGRPVVVAASHGYSGGQVLVWDLQTGAPRSEPFRAPIGSIKAIALGDAGGRPVVVAGGNDSSGGRVLVLEGIWKFEQSS
jgi:hypothetical protein